MADLDISKMLNDINNKLVGINKAINALDKKLDDVEQRLGGEMDDIEENMLTGLEIIDDDVADTKDEVYASLEMSTHRSLERDRQVGKWHNNPSHEMPRRR